MKKIKFNGDLSYKLAFKDKYTDITISSNKAYTKEEMSVICKTHYENDLYLVSGKELEKLETGKENLIKYLEDKKKECQYFMNNVQKGFYNYTIARTKRDTYQDILERVRSGKYE